MDEDYEIDCSDIACGKCGYGPMEPDVDRLVYKAMQSLGWLFPTTPEEVAQEELLRCDECFEGVQRWCPKCGWNWGDEQKTKELDDDGETEQSTDE